MNLIEFIPRGRSNAIAMRELSERLNVDPRTLRALIQREREKGAPICSDWVRGGYFLPADESEAMWYYRAQMARIRTARAALNGVKAYLKGGAAEWKIMLEYREWKQFPKPLKYPDCPCILFGQLSRMVILSPYARGENFLSM